MQATIDPLTARQLTAIPDLQQSQASAARVALAQHSRGSQVIGMTLANVHASMAGLFKTRTVWLVSVDPYGGEYGSGGPPCTTDRSYPANYVIELVTPKGQWLMGWLGRISNMAALPTLGPKARILPASDSSACRAKG